jgi:hypothetical protein
MRLTTRERTLWQLIPRRALMYRLYSDRSTEHNTIQRGGELLVNSDETPNLLVALR